ncbi:MAG: NAD(P)H-dependent oxidoreductase [Wenzhouxiangellaceae bacterium]
MIRVLQVNSSLFGASGQSTGLADTFVEHVRRRHSDAQVTRRGLTPDAIPHLDEETFTAFTTPPEQHTPDQRQRLTLSDELIAELQEANLIVIGLPMYNFSVPSTLKAWFDHVARAGLTFRYTESGPEGLLKGKRAVVACARGGRYSGEADTQTPYIRQFLGFLGIEDVEFVYADGLAMGEGADQSILDASNRLQNIAATTDTTIGTPPEQSGATA